MTTFGAAAMDREDAADRARSREEALDGPVAHGPDGLVVRADAWDCSGTRACAYAYAPPPLQPCIIIKREMT